MSDHQGTYLSALSVLQKGQSSMPPLFLRSDSKSLQPDEGPLIAAETEMSGLDAILLFPLEREAVHDGTVGAARCGLNLSADGRVTQPLADAFALKKDLDELREVTRHPEWDYGQLKGAAIEDLDDSDRTTAAIRDIQRRLDALSAVAEGISLELRARGNPVSPARPPYWSVRFRERILGGLGVLGLVGVVLAGPFLGAGNVHRSEVALPVESTVNVHPPGATAEPVAINGPIVTALAPTPETKPFEKPSASQQVFVGTLVVQSDPPGAAVLINGRPVGTTPLQMLRLSAGSYAVWVEKEGYDRWTAGVRVPADAVAHVSASLRRTVPSVSVELPSDDPILPATSPSL